MYRLLFRNIKQNIHIDKLGFVKIWSFVFHEPPRERHKNGSKRVCTSLVAAREGRHKGATI